MVKREVAPSAAASSRDGSSADDAHPEPRRAYSRGLHPAQAEAPRAARLPDARRPAGPALPAELFWPNAADPRNSLTVALARLPTKQPRRSRPTDPRFAPPSDPEQLGPMERAEHDDLVECWCRRARDPSHRRVARRRPDCRLTREAQQWPASTPGPDRAGELPPMARLARFHDFCYTSRPSNSLHLIVAPLNHISAGIRRSGRDALDAENIAVLKGRVTVSQIGEGRPRNRGSARADDLLP